MSGCFENVRPPFFCCLQRYLFTLYFHDTIIICSQPFFSGTSFLFITTGKKIFSRVFYFSWRFLLRRGRWVRCWLTPWGLHTAPFVPIHQNVQQWDILSNKTTKPTFMCHSDSNLLALRLQGEESMQDQCAKWSNVAKDLWYLYCLPRALTVTSV